MGICREPDRDAEEVQRVTKEAVEIAKANSAFQKKKIELVPTPKVVTTWKSSFERDPFDVPVDEKIAFLLKINEAALAVKGVSFRQFVDGVGQRAEISRDLGRLADRAIHYPRESELLP